MQMGTQVMLGCWSWNSPAASLAPLTHPIIQGTTRPKAGAPTFCKMKGQAIHAGLCQQASLSPPSSLAAPQLRVGGGEKLCGLAPNFKPGSNCSCYQQAVQTDKVHINARWERGWCSCLPRPTANTGTVRGLSGAAADVACRQLGYDNGIISPSSRAQYGGGSVCGAAGSPVAAKNLK